MTQILLRSHCLLFTPAKGSLLCGATDFILLHTSSLTNKCFRLQVYRHPSPLPRVEHIQRLVREDCHLDSSLTSASSIMLNVQVFMIRANARGHNILLCDVFFIFFRSRGRCSLKEFEGVCGRGRVVTLGGKISSRFRTKNVHCLCTCSPFHCKAAKSSYTRSHNDGDGGNRAVPRC